MPKFSFTLCLGALALTLLLPSTRVQSQLAQPVADPLTNIRTMQNANDDLLKRQEATLKELSEMTEMAREAKIFSKRG